MNVIQKSNAMGAQSMTSLEIAQVQGCDESHPKHGASLVEG